MNYWQKRLIKTQETLANKSVREIENQLLKYYARTLESAIYNFEQTYNKLQRTQLDGKEPTPADLYKLDKYWQLQAQIAKELRELGDKQIHLLSHDFELFYFDIY